MQYDFKAVRQRIEELKGIYRRMAQTEVKDGSWDWWLKREITELERQIKEAHKKRKTA